MARKVGGLGRGLDALFADNALEDSAAAGSINLKITQVEPNREQPRKSFDEDSLAELAKSIEESGILQPLIVRPLPDGGYQIVAGERRWRAARLAGLSEVPALVRELSDEEVMVFALIENLQRQDLNPMEEAVGFQNLIDSLGLSQEEVAQRVGKSRPAVANALRLLKLPAKVADFVREGKISAGHARALLAFEDEEELLETARLIIKKGISVREVERLAAAARRESKGKSRQSVRRPAFYDEVELALSTALGRKVKVINRTRQEGGKLEIDYFDLEDLKKLANDLGTAE